MLTPASNKDESAPPRQSVVRQLLSALTVAAVFWGISQAWALWQDKAVARDIKRLASEHDIVMFTTTQCPYCGRARAWMNRHEIRFHDCNVDEDVQCAEQFHRQGAPGVPLMHVRGQWQLGFDPQWLASTLALRPDRTKSP